MGKAPAFQLYAADLLTDVMDWTDEQVGVHIRLLCWSWVNRRGIPRDTQRLTRIAPGVVSAWSVVGEKWSPGPDDTWVNHKLEDSRANSDAFRASQRERSLLAVEARANKKGQNGKPKGKPMGSPMGNPLEGEDEGEVLVQSSGKERAHEPEVIPAGVSAELWAAVKRWEQYRKEKRAALTPSGKAAIIKRWNAVGDTRAIAAIDHSIAQGWTGIYEPKEQTNGARNNANDPNERRRLVIEANAEHFRKQREFEARNQS